MPIGLPIGGKFTVTSNISSMMKGCYEILMINVVGVENFVPVISSEPGYHKFPNLLLRSSNFEDEKYFGFLV